MDNPEKLTRRRKTKQKTQHNMCWTPAYATKHNLQTTRGKDETNIVFTGKSKRTSQHGTKNVKTHNRTTQTKLN